MPLGQSVSFSQACTCVHTFTSIQSMIQHEKCSIFKFQYAYGNIYGIWVSQCVAHEQMQLFGPSGAAHFRYFAIFFPLSLSTPLPTTQKKKS